MNTSYEQIVNINYLGNNENSLKLNDILTSALQENLRPISEYEKKY